MRGELRKEIRGLVAAGVLRLLSAGVGRAVTRRRKLRALLSLRLARAGQRPAEVVHALAPVVTRLRAADTGHTGHVNALAVRRIDQHHARRRRRHALQRVAAAQLHGVRHTGALGVALGKVDHAESHIAAEHRRHGRGNGGLGLTQQAFPHVRLKGQIFLEGKAPVQAGRDVAGDLRSFDDDGARAAAGVVQRHALFTQTAFAAPAAGGQHGGSQGFLQWCVALVFAPAALEQRLARGVDVNGDGVGGQVRVDAHVGPARVHVGAHIEFVPEAVRYRVLDLERGKVQAVQRTVLRRDLDLEALLGREPDFPGHVAGGAVQVLFVAVLGVL